MASEYYTQRNALIAAITTAGFNVYYHADYDKFSFPAISFRMAGSEEQQTGKKSYTKAYKYIVEVFYNCATATGSPTNSEYDTAGDNAWSKIDSLMTELKANSTYGKLISFETMEGPLFFVSGGKTIAGAVCEFKVNDIPVETYNK